MRHLPNGVTSVRVPTRLIIQGKGMSLIDFIAVEPALTMASLIGIVIVFYSLYLHYSSNKYELSGLLAIAILINVYLFGSVYSAESKANSNANTIVVMPDKKNLRLAEDGNLSFCLNGMARTWEKTENGIISTTEKRHLGKPMRCLSIKESIDFLAKNGATKEELTAFVKAYSD